LYVRRRDLEVIGERWIARAVGAGVAAGTGVVLGAGAAVLPATAPPVVADRAGVAAMARIVKLLRNVLRVRTRKTTTSFVGLRG
jgi:hypothetical protein